MTDRHKGYIVVLDRDIREDDAEESVLAALRMIKGVVDVTPVVNNAESAIERMRIHNEVRSKFYAFMEDALG